MNSFILRMQDVFNFVKGITPTYTTEIEDEMVVEENGRFYHLKVTEITNTDECPPRVRDLVEMIKKYKIDKEVK